MNIRSLTDDACHVRPTALKPGVAVTPLGTDGAVVSLTVVVKATGALYPPTCPLTSRYRARDQYGLFPATPFRTATVEPDPTSTMAAFVQMGTVVASGAGLAFSSYSPVNSTCVPNRSVMALASVFVVG